MSSLNENFEGSGELNSLIGVSWPRSGHRLLVDLLYGYFGSRFGYCERYTPKGCCRQVPCAREPRINFSKNHDHDAVVPVLPNRIYVIQYREFLHSLVSNFELYVGENKIDTFKEFRRFADSQSVKYRLFLNRWTIASADNTTFVRISYELLTKIPLDVIEPLVKFMLPRDEEINRERLMAALSSVDQVTVTRGIEVNQSGAGIRLRGRDIKSFRYYDERLFNHLDQQTKAAYQEMAALPLVAKSGSTTPIRRRSKPGRIWVDGTFALMSPEMRAAPSGIARFEDFLVRSAAAGGDPIVKIAVYDQDLEAYREPRDYERGLLTEAPEQRRPGLRGALRQIRRNPHLGRAFERDAAARLAGGHVGPVYTISRTLLRVYRHLYRWLFPKHADQREGPINPNDGLVLMSHAAIESSLFPKSLLSTDKRAFVCDDMSPILPGDQADASRLDANFRILFRSGALALCTSNRARETLTRFISGIGNVPVGMTQISLSSETTEAWAVVKTALIDYSDALTGPFPASTGARDLQQGGSGSARS